MTEQQNEATEPTASDQDQQASRPQVKNVRPGAVSGIDHHILNPDAAAQAEAAANDDAADLNPETDTDPSVHLAGDTSEQSEGEKPGAGGDQTDDGQTDDGNDSPAPQGDGGGEGQPANPDTPQS